MLTAEERELRDKITIHLIQLATEFPHGGWCRRDLDLMNLKVALDRKEIIHRISERGDLPRIVALVLDAFLELAKAPGETSLELVIDTRVLKTVAMSQSSIIDNWRRLRVAR